jgi:Fe-S cluster assembly protein SufD
MSNLVESIAELSAVLPGSHALSEQRAAALEAFRVRGLPNTSDENWRYTDITRLGGTQFEFSPPAQFANPVMESLPIDGDRIVFINGHLSQELTQIESPESTGIHILDADWSSLTSGFPLNDAVIEHPLGQINTATTRHGVLIRPPATAQAPRPIHIVVAHTGNAQLALQPRIVIDLAENAAARVVLQFVSGNETAGWTNAVTEIRQARGSRLDFVQLQENSTKHTHTALVRAALQRDASASISCFDLGAALARNDIDITLDGAGSETEVFGCFVPLQSQHIDNHVRIDHAAANTRSTAVFRGIAGAASRGVFSGKVIVRPGAQKISAQTSTDNLLLSPDAEIDAKPELEIYADDVKCSHGATVGELDEQHLFYLRSRGIDADAARALLTYAFAQTVVERIADAALRSAIAARIASRLPEHERWERLT